MKITFLLGLMITLTPCYNFKIFTTDGVDKDEYCYQSLGDGCQNCFMAFLNDDTCQQPKTEIENCIKYRDGSNCWMCQLGLELVNNECVKIDQPEHCVSKSITGKCDLCVDGMYVDNEGNCTQKCTLSNCDICDFDFLQNLEKCYLCKPGYSSHLEDDGEKLVYSCVKDTNIKNCWVTRPNFINKCYKCKINYYENDQGECIKSSKYNTSLMNGIKRIIISFIFAFLI